MTASTSDGRAVRPGRADLLEKNTTGKRLQPVAGDHFSPVSMVVNLKLIARNHSIAVFCSTLLMK